MEKEMKIGYARVSTLDQELEIQLKALSDAGCAIIYQEKISGATKRRPELLKLLSELRPKDVIVVWKLDRLARSTRQLLEITEKIKKRKALFQSLCEPWADTTSFSGKMIMTVFAGIAEYERDLIRERTFRGREEAIKRGVRFGRPKKLNEEQISSIRQKLKEGRSIVELAAEFNVHKSTIYRLRKTRKRRMKKNFYVSQI